VGEVEPRPDWVIDFNPDSDETRTWDSIFDIRVCCKRTLSGRSYYDWLVSFGDLCKSAEIDCTDKGVVEGLKRYCELLRAKPMVGQNFFGVEIFDVFRTLCKSGEHRPMNFIRNITRLKLPHAV
jgi:hypothetical protein